MTKQGKRLKAGNLKVLSKTVDEQTLPFRTECFAGKHKNLMKTIVVLIQ